MTNQAYLERLRNLSNRLVALQKPIRILDAIKWPADLEIRFMAKGGRELPQLDVDFYQKQRLAFDTDKVYQLLKELKADVRRELGRGDALGQILLATIDQYQIVIELLRRYDELPEEDNNIVKGTNMSQIATALDYMNKHYSESIKAGELSELCNMSETHFRRLFESYINMPPMEYLNLIRVQKACELMKKTNEPMELIAQKCGFTTQSTFNRNFRKFLDTSPYQWKINPENYEHKLLNFRISALKGW